MRDEAVGLGKSDNGVRSRISKKVTPLMAWWPSRTFLNYLALQIPGWLLFLVVLVLLRSRLGLPAWQAGVLLGLLAAKDLLLFPLLRRAYEDDPRTGGERLVGSRATVVTALRPQGYVRVRGELWRAETSDGIGNVPEGSTVTICGARGLTLAVKPD